MKRYKYAIFDEVYDVWLEQAKYPNGRVALQLMDNEGPVATATVNLPDDKLYPGEVFIKTWSENEMMLDFLISNKIVEDTGRMTIVGHGCKAVVCKLLEQPVLQ